MELGPKRGASTAPKITRLGREVICGGSFSAVVDPMGKLVRVRAVPDQKRPAKLSAEAGQFWDDVVAAYDLADDSMALHLLGELCSILDRMRAVPIGSGEPAAFEAATINGSLRRGV